MFPKNDLLAVALLGAVANFPWEMAHLPLYQGTSQFAWWQHLLCCGGAAVLDGVGIAVIFWLGAIFFGEPRWTLHRCVSRWAFVVALGLTAAIGTERVALSLGWWNYERAMPLLPGTGLGLSPILQFMTLPTAVLFGALPQWWNWKERNDDTSPA